MKIKCKAYHGTDIYSKQQIMKSQYFEKSSKDNEWAGTGVYFFIDSDPETASNNAYSWAKNFKKIPIYNIRIVPVDIEYNKEEILDLCNDDGIALFNDFRRMYFKRAVDVARSKGKILSDDKYKNSTKFDCLVINTICEKSKFKLVKKYVYISKLEDVYDGENIPYSYVPNCTIASVRDQKIIKKIGD